MTVQELIERGHGRSLPRLAAHHIVADALTAMAKAETGAVLVMNGPFIEGIFTERDYSRKLLLRGRSSLRTPLAEVMQKEVMYISPDYSLEQALAVMTKANSPYVLVLEDNQIRATISLCEVASALVDDKDFMIDELVKYISGTPLGHEVARERNPRIYRVAAVIWDEGDLDRWKNFSAPPGR